MEMEQGPKQIQAEEKKDVNGEQGEGSQRKTSIPEKYNPGMLSKIEDGSGNNPKTILATPSPFK